MALLLHLAAAYFAASCASVVILASIAWFESYTGRV